MRNLAWLVSGLLVCSCAIARADEEDAVRVFKQLRPAVVSLENAEGSGTGILLNADGLILTNAHVVTSPLPFTVKIDTGKDADLTYNVGKSRKTWRSSTSRTSSTSWPRPRPRRESWWRRRTRVSPCSRVSRPTP